MNRIKTGALGLDELIEDGFPEGSNILVTGGPGTGKSILGLQYIVYGALNGEPGVYLTVEENKDKILSQANQFGWNIEKLEREKKMVVNTIEESDIDEILDNLKSEVKQLKAKRVVVDSLSMMSIFTRVLDKVSKTMKKPDILHAHGQELNRSQIIGILKKLSELGTTNLIISEGELPSDKIAEFAADGVIRMMANPTIKVRMLSIDKMRETKIELGNHEFNFTDQGITIKK